MLRRLLISVLALFAGAAIAQSATPTNGTQTANLSWVAPAFYSDNSPLPATDIANYTISFNGTTMNAAATATSATVSALCGTVNFTVTVTTTATAKYPNATSGPAGPVPFVSSVNCMPMPPTGFGVK